MSRHEDRIRLEDMRSYAQELVELCAHRDRADLDRDRVFSLAVIRLLEVTGEAAARVSERVQEGHPEIDWAAIVGMRNRLIHGYGEVDLGIVWAVIKGDLPVLVRQVDAILAELGER